MTAPRRLRALAAACALLSSSVAGAEVFFFPTRGDKSDIPYEYARFDVKEWFSTGSGRFVKTVPFPFTTNPPIPPDQISMGSTLNFDKMSCNVTVFSGEVRPLGWLSAAVDMGSDSTSGGIGHDHDWVNSPAYDLYSPSGFIYRSPNRQDFSLSQSSLDGTFKFTTPTAYVRVAALREAIDSGLTYTHLFDVGLGYTWYDENVHMTDFVQLSAPDDFMNAAFGIPPPGAYPGQDSTYKFHWEGLRIALREKMIFGPDFSSEGKFGFVPAARYTGTGVWNLRPDLQQNPSFTQTTVGHGYDFSLDLTYQAFRYVALKAGFMLQYFTAAGGTDTMHFISPPDISNNLVQVKSFRSGAFVGASLQF